MLYRCPEKIWQERPSNISNLYCWNTVLHQRTLQGRRSTHKSWVLFPPSSNAASPVGCKVSLFNDASSHLLTDNNKFPHYYILLCIAPPRAMVVCYVIVLHLCTPYVSNCTPVMFNCTPCICTHRSQLTCAATVNVWQYCCNSLFPSANSLYDHMQPLGIPVCLPYVLHVEVISLSFVTQ